MQILDSEYNVFMKALYSDEELDIQGSRFPTELMQKLLELRKMMETRTAVGEDSIDDEESDGSGSSDD